ncbi:MAG TPA: SMC family ATPase [Anaerolineae bacterium]|nr:SMC family ATPase [Anaerolineae bacterium]
MFNLKSLRLHGFRGFPKEDGLFEFSAPAVLLFGDNHQGKSSVLNGIEWCLYGHECVGTKSGIRERVGGWELVNRQSPKATVDLVIDTEEGDVTITRTEQKGKGKRGRHVQVALADGRVLRGNEAERQIAGLLRMSFGDFATVVYQHQESIRAILIQMPKDRNEAIDRLLGLGEYRNVLEGIKGAKLTRIQRELATEREKFEGRVEQALAVRRSDLEEKVDAAIGQGLDEGELGVQGALELSKLIVKDLQEFASELGVPSTPPAVPSGWKEMDTFLAVAARELDRLWSQAPDVKAQSELNKRRGQAERTREQYAASRAELTQAVYDLGSFEAEHGIRDQIGQDIVLIERQIDEGTQQIREISPRALLVEEGIALLKSARSGLGAEVCPLCGQRVPNLLAHLEKEWIDKLEAEVRHMQAGVEQLRARKKELEHVAEDHHSLAQAVQRAQMELAKSAQRAADLLGRKLTKDDDPLALLTKSIKEADERLAEIESALSQKRAKLAAISASIGKANLVLEILLLEHKIRGIEKIAHTAEFKVLGHCRDKAAELISDVEAVGILVRESLAEEARSRISAAGTAIDDYFRRVAQNPAIGGLSIEVQDDARSGGNSYSFCDRNGQELSPVLSQGDLNSLALSIFLGMVTAYSHPVGFVLMDDPSQSLGTDQKRRLVEVVEDVCESGRQVVLATMDAELQGFLKSSLGKTKSIYQIQGWTPELGPTVSLEA